MKFLLYMKSKFRDERQLFLRPWMILETKLRPWQALVCEHSASRR